MARICVGDQYTVLGRSIRTIADLCNTDIPSLSPHLVKKRVSYRTAEENEVWRISADKELLSLRDHHSSLPGFTREEIDEMLDYICIT